MQFQNSILKYGVNLVAASIRRHYQSAHENPGRAFGPKTFAAVTQSLALPVEIKRSVIATDLDGFQLQTWQIELEQILFACVGEVHGGKPVRVLYALPAYGHRVQRRPK
jgi:hypothetical protein